MRPVSMFALSLLLVACGKDTASKWSEDPKQGPSKTATRSETAPTDPPGDGPAGCDLARLTEFAKKLATATVHERPNVAIEGLTKSCTLPEFLPPYFELAERSGPGGPPAAPLDPSTWADVYERACPKHVQVAAAAAQVAADNRPYVVFDGCDFQRFRVAPANHRERSDPNASPLPFVTYQWLTEQGADAELARVYGAALEAYDRQQLGPIIPSPNLVLPLAPGSLDPIPKDGVFVHVSQDALATDHHRIATLDGGRLRPQDSNNHLIGALFDELAETADTGKTLAERAGDKWAGRVVIVADEQVPYETIMGVMYTAGRAEFLHYAFVLDKGGSDYGIVPVEPPRLSAKPTTGTSAPLLGLALDDKASLQVVIDSGGYQVRDRSITTAVPERIGVRAAVGHDAWDFDALTARAKRHRAQHPANTLALVSPQATTPYGVVVRSFAALRGYDCASKDDCALPDLVATASGTLSAAPIPSGTTKSLADILGGTEPATDIGIDAALGTKSTAEPKIRPGSAEVAGTLDKDIIRRIVRSHLSEVRSCYNAALLLNPKEAGTVDIEFAIGPDGKVASAKVARSTVGSKTLSACIRKQVLGWKFPRPHGGSVTVRYPFVFAPS